MTACSCPPNTGHGGHTINMGMPVTTPPTDGDRSPQTTTDPLTDERLRQFATDEYVCVTDVVRSMAAELLALRAYATDHEGRCNTLCPRCGIEVDHEIGNLTQQEAQAALDAMPASIDHDQAGAAELEAEGYGACTPAPMPPDIAAAKARIAELEAERPRFSQRQFIQAHRDRDEAQARAAELAERFTELEAQQDTYRREYRELHISCEKRVEERNDALAVIDRVRDALAGHPRCEDHPEGDVIKCGWKRAVASVQWALDNAPAQREPIGYGVVVEGTEGVGGLWVQTSPLLRESDAVDRARFYAHQGARAVAMTEVESK